MTDPRRPHERREGGGMTEPEALRSAARDVLAELLGQAKSNANGHSEVVPQVPPPPVAAVLRPSTWAAPPIPGEVVGEREPEAGVSVEVVTIESDADLQRFVQSVLNRAELIRAGRVRFALGVGDSPSRNDSLSHPGGTTVHIAKGAVTERTIRGAAAERNRIVLGRRAVLTPLARDTARKLGVEIEKEAPC